MNRAGAAPSGRKRALALDLAAALLAAAALRLRAPLPPGDPFAGVLSALPWAVVALRAWARALPARSAPPARPPSRGRAVAVALLALVTLTLVRPTLGLAGLDMALAGGYLLLLAVWVQGQLPTLRRRLGRRLPKTPSAVFFFLPLIVYLALLPWSTGQRPPDGDEPYYLLLTHSLAYDLDTDLANNYADADWRRFLDRPLEPQPGDPVGPRGERYSRHNVLLPLVLAPAYRLGGLPAVLAMMAAIAAGTAWMTLRLAHRLAPTRVEGALRAYLLLAFAPPFILYSQQVWIEGPAALLLALAVDRLLAVRARGTMRAAMNNGDAVVLAATLIALPLLKLRFVLLALPVLLLAGYLARRARMAWIAGGAVVAAFAAALLINQARYGNPLKMHSPGELRVLEQPPAAFVLGGLGMFYDVAFGLFACAPLWLLLLPAAALAIRARSRPALGLLVIVAPYLLALAPRFEWYGGWSPPFRYPLVLLPLLALLTIPLLDRRRAGTRFLGVALGLATAALTVLWLVVPGWTYDLADGGSHLLDGAGARYGLDLGRFFPSMVRPRLATWLWPLASLLLIPLALWRRAPRRPLWGALAVLAAALAVTVAAERLPTRTVELEDGYVVHRGGAPHPPPWTAERPRHRGGWTILPRSEAAAPVIGSGPVTVRLAVRHLDNDPARPFTLEIAAADVVLERWRARAEPGWQILEIGPVDWPEGAPLVLRGAAEIGGGPRDGVIVDYADFLWRR